MNTDATMNLHANFAELTLIVSNGVHGSSTYTYEKKMYVYIFYWVI